MLKKAIEHLFITNIAPFLGGNLTKHLFVRKSDKAVSSLSAYRSSDHLLNVVFVSRLKEKERLFSMFRELERQMKDSHFELDKDLQPEGLERNWSHLMMLFQVCYKR